MTPAGVLLLVTDIDRIDRLRALLDETTDLRAIGSAATTGEVLDILSAGPVDIVLVAEDVGPLLPLDLVRQIGASFPTVAVVLMSRESTSETLSAALKAGARGVCPVDPTLDELTGSLQPAAQWARQMREALSVHATPALRGSTIVFAGAKGGVGTTTTATFAALLAATEPGKRICLVDLNLQAGDVASLLDIKHRRTILDLVDVADDLSGTLLQDALFPHPSGLHVLLAPAEGEHFDAVRSQVARQVLGALRLRFDTLIIDVGSVMNEASTVAVEMADRVVLSLTPDVLSLRAAQRQVALWGRLHARKADDVSILLVQSSRSADVQRDVVGRALGCELLDVTVPADFKSLQPVVNSLSPEVLPDGPLKRAYTALATELGLLGLQRGTAKESGRSHSRRSRRGKDAGQSAIETLALAPVMLLIVLLLWQAVLTGLAVVMSGRAADAGARQLSYDTVEHAEIKARSAVGSIFGGDVRAAADKGAGRVVVRVGVPVLVAPLGIGWHVSSSAEIPAEP